MEKRYLGDGCYVQEWDAGGLMLTTENGIAVTNTIYLEPEVWRELRAYAAEYFSEQLEKDTGII
jgi:hypothetical protein